MKAVLLSLIQSRKFWLTLLSVASAVGAYLHHSIQAAQLSDIIAASVSVLVLAIAHEDHGTNSNVLSISTKADTSATTSTISEVTK